MGDPVTEGAIRGLEIVAEQRVNSGRYGLAIQAYRAVLSFSLPAMQEARARISLATVLLSQTYEHLLAKEELDKAVRAKGQLQQRQTHIHNLAPLLQQMLLTTLPGHAPLQLEILDQLAQYHCMLGEFRKQQEACHQGINLWDRISAAERCAAVAARLPCIASST